MPKLSKKLTPDMVKAKFEAEGITMTAWAKAHGFTPLAVYQVLNGYSRGTRGNSRKIAIALGLREPHPERDAA